MGTAVCHPYLGLCNASIINLHNADQAFAAAGLSVGAVALQVADLLIQAHIVCLLDCQLTLILLHLRSARGHFFFQLRLPVTAVKTASDAHLGLVKLTSSNCDTL